ncbi:MAG TPA: hypothetical protein QGH03_01675, partial [Candidatus Paceibacterota bacterium]|nr:hypothetical protein [Candidatus Paceibacterota bacterium]
MELDYLNGTGIRSKDISGNTGNELIFGEEKYISSRRGAEKYGYTNDYLASLCRSGKLKSKMVGRAWYIEENSLINFIEAAKFQKHLVNKKKEELLKRTFKIKRDHLKKRSKISTFVFLIGLIGASLMPLSVEKSPVISLNTDGYGFDYKFSYNIDKFSGVKSLITGTTDEISDSITVLVKYVAQANLFKTDDFNESNETNIVRKEIVTDERGLELIEVFSEETPYKESLDSSEEVIIKKMVIVTNPTEAPQKVVVANSPQTQTTNQSSSDNSSNDTFQVIDNNFVDELKISIDSLRNDVYKKLNGINTGRNTIIQNVYNQIAGTNNIDKLSEVDITNPTISGGTISGLSISRSSFSGTTGTYTGNVSGSTLTGTGTGTSTLSGGLYASLISAPYFHATSTATSTFAGGLNVLYLNQTGSSATSTFATGIDLTDGCFSIGGTCVGGSSVTGTQGQVTYFSGTNTAVGTSTIFIDTAGNVGIGTTTPNWNLQVAGTRPSLALSDTNAAADKKHWLLSSMGGNLYVGTSTDAYGTSTPPALTITNAGLVGIGTTSPPRGFSTNKNVVAHFGGQVEFATTKQVAFLDDTNSADNTYFQRPQDQILYIAANDGIVFRHAGEAETMRLSSDGNVGIGTTNPTVTLHIVADGQPMKVDRTDADGTMIDFERNTVGIGSIGVSGSTVSYNAFTGSHYAWTDETIERNILVSLTEDNRNLH